jgi:hypothetical protein
MSATLTLHRPGAARDKTLADDLAPMHDRWMAECDLALGPVTDRDATFLQRWAAIRYVAETFPERFEVEQELVKELRPFILPEIRERLQMQMDRLIRLQQELERLARLRGTARDVARLARDLEEALRLWYADLEFAVGDLCPDEIGPLATRLLERACSDGRLDDWFVAVGHEFDSPSGHGLVGVRGV